MAFSSFNLSQSLPMGVGGGGYSGSQVTGMIEWGRKSTPPQKKTPRASNKTPKKLWTKIKPPKNPLPNFCAIKMSRKHTYKI